MLVLQVSLFVRPFQEFHGQLGHRVTIHIEVLLVDRTVKLLGVCSVGDVADIRRALKHLHLAELADPSEGRRLPIMDVSVKHLRDVDGANGDPRWQPLVQLDVD